jgi:hypothetical protein
MAIVQLGSRPPGTNNGTLMAAVYAATIKIANAMKPIVRTSVFSLANIPVTSIQVEIALLLEIFAR